MNKPHIQKLFDALNIYKRTTDHANSTMEHQKALKRLEVALGQLGVADSFNWSEVGE